MRFKIPKLAATIVALGAVCRPASAHHSMAMFDIAKEVTLTGTVIKLQYTNPHIYLFVEIEKDGKTQPLRVEGGSPSGLNRVGWNSKILQPGDKISVNMRPTKDGESNFGMLVSVTKADGSKLLAGTNAGPDN